jgi:uncharacterized membrane protein (UPF0127 family)
MMKLVNKTQNKLIAQDLKLATGFKDRLVGMMGRKNFPEGYALKLEKCNWVHTCFMRTPIDLIFLDKKGEVKQIIWKLSEWRFSPFVWSADSVIEIPSGRIDTHSVSLGDKLDVEP